MNAECGSGKRLVIPMTSCHRFAIGTSRSYSAVRSSLTRSGSGYLKYLYSPRPNPCRAMTTRLRNRSSRSYPAASDVASSAVSSAERTAHPCRSRCSFAAFQSYRPARACTFMGTSVPSASPELFPSLAFEFRRRRLELLRLRTELPEMRRRESHRALECATERRLRVVADVSGDGCHFPSGRRQQAGGQLQAPLHQVLHRGDTDKRRESFREH